MVVIMDEMSLYTTLKDIYFTLDNGDRRLLETFNLSVPRFYLLKHISENPGISLTSLSGLMLTDKSNITRLIQSVEAQDLVCKKQNETDRRSLSLYLTQNGQRLLDAALDAHRSYTEERFQPVHEHVNGLLHNLVAMKKILDSQLED